MYKESGITVDNSVKVIAKWKWNEACGNVNAAGGDVKRVSGTSVCIFLLIWTCTTSHHIDTWFYVLTKFG